MTDKEIVERAKKAEKRTCFGELVHSPISKGVNSAFGIGFIEGMVEYRNSLQEEPVSSIWHDASEPPIIDKTFLLVAPNGNSSLCLWGGKELHSVTIGGGHSVLCKGDIYSYIDDLLNFDNSRNFGKNLQEVPVSEDLEAELDKYIKGNFTIDKEQLDRFGIEEKDYMYSMDKSDILTMVRYFTNLQKEKDIEIITDVGAVAFANGMAQMKKQIEEPVSEGRDIFDNCLKGEEEFILPQKISGNIDCENCLYSSACALGDIQECIMDKLVSEDLEAASKEWLRLQLDKSYANYGETKMMELTHFDGYAMLDAIEFGAKWQKEKNEFITEDLGEYINELSKQFPEVSFAKLSRIAVRVAKWQKNHLWKPADGDDLPEIDREVIALVQDYPDDKDHLRVVFTHRPNKYAKVWNSDLGEEQVIEIERYDKGGWNIPNIMYWLDVELPKY